MSQGRTFGKLAGDSRGQVTVEWTLILAGFALPMIYVFKLLGSVLAEHYKMITFFETLPFP